VTGWWLKRLSRNDWDAYSPSKSGGYEEVRRKEKRKRKRRAGEGRKLEDEGGKGSWYPKRLEKEGKGEGTEGG
jgi:hypothetical protein